MSQYSGNIEDFGMDTISLAGPLEAKLKAVREAGFTQIMLAAKDIVGHPHGIEAAVAAVRSSGLRVTGFQVLRDFEGLSGHLHDYKIDIAKSMLEMCHTLGCHLLLVCSSTSVHATGDHTALVRDLRKLAMLAIPMNIKIAYEALSWGRVVNEFPQAWDIVCEADMPNLGLGFDSFHMFATSTPLEALDILDPDKIFLVQLADFMWLDIKSVEERITTARRWRRWSTSSTTWATGATTVLKSSMTTTRPCRCRPWRSVRGGRHCGWAKRCCDDRCRCPIRSV